MTLNIGFLLFPNVTQLDMTGPAQVLSRVPGASVYYIWEHLEPVMTDAKFSINPTATFESCPQLDVLVVPGGFGVTQQLNYAPTISFLARQGIAARYVCSVCNGSLLLGAAGLLIGYKSACHWAWRDGLIPFGAIPTNARVVRDRNRMSGGGVTAGIDFGLTLAAELAGENIAKGLQLTFEYDPQPPFDCGTPEKAAPEILALAQVALQARRVAVDSAIAEAAAKLNFS
jgi:cyclohexyl-isocyanide hydratase